MKFFVVLLLAITSFGCTTLMKGSIDSTPDPTYTFDRHSPVVVTVVSSSKNALESKYFIHKAVNELKKNGFDKVFLEGDIGNISEPIKLVFFIDVSNKTTSYAYRSADYGTVQTGSYTNCNAYANRIGTGATAYCTTTPTTSYQIVGYSDKVGYTTGHFFNLIAIDMQNKQNVLSVVASSFNSGCSDEKLYEFLLEQAISRMSLVHKIKQDFEVEMPEEYQCK
ncbi:hypothetical protein SAMN05880558_11271 [Aeromonas sp. RU39B]|uniref:hypothetical protein n=1 Tax=Aeromonas sp. RU39B TaxID=1907416 RepID=UPI000956E8E5|nr:hypothetical protein [Aeromonas sp. RU39B]SIR35866.1 hypothetical protein SAMN05880558_11271 [Aeromonas sp. RU39B]